MSWATPQTYPNPAAPAGAQWTFAVRAKLFEANTPALLEVAMNNWMTLLDDIDLSDFAILDVQYQSGAKEKALVTYGYFVRVTQI
jgi:hypothetical protein